MGNSIGISAPDHTLGSVLGPGACATIISLHVGVGWKLLLAAFLLEKSSQQTVSVEWQLHCLGRGSSGACCTWPGVKYLQYVPSVGMTTDVARGHDWELCLQVDLKWNCRCDGHQRQQRGFIFRLCIPSFGGQVGEDS